MNRNSKILRTFALALAITGAAAADGLAQKPNAPSKLVAIPNYDAGWIELTWQDNSTNEQSFEIYRKTNGGPFKKIITISANSTSTADATVDAKTEYVYVVKAVNAAGASNASNEEAQNYKVLWPVAKSHEILHNWNETIGASGIGDGATHAGFHRGVDIQRVGKKDEVTAPRGGVIALVVPAPPALPAPNTVVFVRVKVGTKYEWDEFNHLAAGPPAKIGQVVKAGDLLGKIDESGTLFSGVKFVQHTHFDLVDPTTKKGIPRHPLDMFTANADRDPKGKNPKFTDHPGSPAGTMLFRRNTPGSAYLTFDATHPLFGDLDIIAELGDELGTNPDQVPQWIEWWIEPPPKTGCTRYSGVRTAAQPYVFFKWDRLYFGAGQTNTSFMATIVDVKQNYAPFIKEGTETYPANWQNYKHFIITNTNDTVGTMAGIDASQYWNTDAKYEELDWTVKEANFAKKADTKKAQESRFPDGIYTLKIRLADLVHKGVVESTSFRLENFPPVVCDAVPVPKSTLPNTTTDVAGSVTFSEAMNTTVAAGNLVTVNAGATIQNTAWNGDRMLTFAIKGLKKGTRYTVTISKNARDLPGTPGNKQLDGNQDGVAGDDATYDFAIAN